jgi:hypothetical protein
MSAEPEPNTISWDEAIDQLAKGTDRTTATKRLYRAVVDRTIDHRPPLAIPLEGRLDPNTGAARMSSRDHRPRFLRIVRSDFERHFQLGDRDDARDGQIACGYMPGYLALIHRAIRELKITTNNQPKAEVLQKWFREQNVAGERVSKNLARTMTTIAREPERKRGGAIPQRSKG